MIVGCAPVKVGHRQALILKTPVGDPTGVFFRLFSSFLSFLSFFCFVLRANRTGLGRSVPQLSPKRHSQWFYTVGACGTCGVTHLDAGLAQRPN